MNEKRLQYKKYFNILILLLFAAIPPIFYSGIIDKGMLLVSGDGASYFSLRAFFNDAIWSGEFPYWNKYLEGGIPYGAYDSVGLYPIGLLLSFLSPDIFSYAFYFFHLIIGAYFLYLFLQEIGCNRFASLIVSVIYETSIHINGYRKAHIMLIVGIVYLPVILYFIQKYLNTGKLKFLICSSVFMGIQFLGAHTQVVFYTDVVCFFYLLVYFIKNKEKVKKVISHFTAWLLTYLGVIFAQLYTTVLLFIDMKSIGTEPNSFANFKSYSIHFVKLLQMAFPYIFGDNINQAISPMYSSEMDIELFLGFFVLICLIFCGTHLVKKFEIKLSLFFMAIAFVYSAMGHIPFLAQIIYKLPVFGSFRVASRALFIFVFFAFVCLGIFITEIQKQNIMENFLNFGEKVTAAVLGGIITIGLGAIALAESEDAIVTVLFKLEKVFLPATIVCAVILLIVFVYKYIPAAKNNVKKFYSIFCVIILCSTLAETYNFSKNTNSVSKDYFTISSSNITEEISNSNYKVLDAFYSIDGAHDSLIGLNSAVDKKIMGINSYLTYNNPRLYSILSGKNTIQMNFSGLFSGFPNMQEILTQKNDLLSVLGIKYLIDSSGLLAENPRYFSSFNVSKKIYSDENVSYLMSSANEFNIYNAAVDLLPNTAYKIEFDLDCSTFPEMMYVDVLTSSGYDGYNKDIYYNASDRHFSIYYSTAAEDYSGSSVRLVMINSTDVSVSNFTISECTPYVSDNAIIYSSEERILPASEPNGYSLISDGINLIPNKKYMVSFNSYTESPADFFYVDFYAEGFDDPEQQINATLIPGKKQRHTYIFNSGNCPEDLSVRFVACGSSDIQLSDISVTDMLNSDSGMYYPYYSGEEGNIYINPNAKNILFTVDNVKSVSENENIYSSIEEHDLLNTAYVRDYESNLDLTDTSTQITDINFTNNAITATVNTDKDTFLNFSQCYYPGWKAYVDGKETSVYIVDDVIMGADVPAGQHTIEFRYAIPYFAVAVVFSVGVVVFWVIYFKIKDNVKHKTQDDSIK